ncbi:hypothetical protein CGRA01v4_13848 [Colletotrichum graminicola]|nr:hypothetical protein CGRA01v4_13848 [Colletotrichum graminicola]
MRPNTPQLKSYDSSSGGPPPPPPSSTACVLGVVMRGPGSLRAWVDGLDCHVDHHAGGIPVRQRELNRNQAAFLIVGCPPYYWQSLREALALPHANVAGFSKTCESGSPAYCCVHRRLMLAYESLYPHMLVSFLSLSLSLSLSFLIIFNYYYFLYFFLPLPFFDGKCDGVLDCTLVEE